MRHTLRLLLLLVFCSLPVQVAGAQDNDLCYLIADQTTSTDSQDQLTSINKFEGEGEDISSIAYSDGTPSRNLEAAALGPTQSPLLYGVTNRIDQTTGETADQFGFINIRRADGISDGTFIPIGDGLDTGDGSLGTVDFEDIDGLAFDYTDSLLFAVERRSGAGDADLLLRINPNTGEVVQDAFGSDEYVTIDPFTTSGGATLADIDDIAFDPGTGELYGIANDGTGLADRNVIVLIDRTDGSTTEISNPQLGDVEGITFDYRRNLFATTGTDSENSDNQNAFFFIDRETGTVFKIAPPPPGPFGGGGSLSFLDYEAVACLLPVEQYADGVAGWRMLSAPSTSLTIRDLAEQNLVQGVPGSQYSDFAPNLYVSYDGTNYEVPTSISDTLQPGQGLIWYLYDEAKVPETNPTPDTLSATGVILDEDLTVSVPQNGDQAFYLLGNPYDVAFDLDDLNLSEQGFFTTVYVWNPNEMSYVAISQGDQGNFIPRWQGFFVCRLMSTATTLTFNADGRSVTRDPVFFGVEGPEEAQTRAVLPLLLEGMGAKGEVVTRDKAVRLFFHEDATAGWDVWDAPKMTPLTDTYATLSFVAEEPRAGTHLKGQESLPLWPEGTLTVPLALQTTSDAERFVISWSQDDWENIPAAWQITLLDRATGAEVDLRTESSYAFGADDADGASQNAVQAEPDPLTVGEAVLQAHTEDGSARFAMRIEAGNATPGGIPDAFALRSNYPNPFSGATTLRYALPEAAHVRVEVYDILGRKVATVVDEEQTAGEKKVRFNATGLAPGVYVYRVEAGGRAEQGRMVLVK